MAESLDNKIQQLIAQLPQGARIDPADAARWIQGVERYHAKQAGWHIQRLKGVGGSEMGAVVRHYAAPHESGFQNIRQVVESKLLKRLPSFETHHMRRGTRLEDLARLAFLFRYKAERDEKALKAFQSKPSTPASDRLSWLSGNPDDFVLIGKKRFLVDYKVPARYDEHIAFDYDVQLHHYGLGAQLRGIGCQAYILAKLDLAPEFSEHLSERIVRMTQEQVIALAQSIARVDTPNFRVVGHVIEPRKDMLLDIIEYGGHCWNTMVLEGKCPEIQVRKKAQLEAPQKKKIEALQQRYLSLKALTDKASEQSKEVVSEISKTFEGVSLESIELPNPLVKIEHKKGYEPQALIQEALSYGACEDELYSDTLKPSVSAMLAEIKRLKGNPDAPHLYESPQIDVDKAADFLKAKGIDLEPFEKRDVRVSLSMKKDHKEQYQQLAETVFSEFEAWRESQEYQEQIMAIDQGAGRAKADEDNALDDQSSNDSAPEAPPAFVHKNFGM